MSNNKFPYTITDDAITMILAGKPVVLGRSFPGYLACARALLDGRFDDAARCSTLTGAIPSWHQEFYLSEDGRTVHHRDRQLPAKLSGRLLRMCQMGEDPAPLFAFWRRLANNPSQNSVSQLYDFLENKAIPISSDGYVLAYKAVRRDFLDIHSATIDNSPGRAPRMPREQVSEDPQSACSAGLHVGSLEYASKFGPDDRKIVICKVDPADVVSVPADHSCQKMRVCSYLVVGLHSGQEMSSTVESDELSSEESEDAAEKEDSCVVGMRCAACEPGAVPGEPTPSPALFDIPRRYQKYASMDAADLMQLPLEFLRELAGKAFRIVGASKVRGGKNELVRLIEEARDR